MSFEKIRKALDSGLKTAAPEGLDIVLDNVNIKPNQSTPFLSASLLPASVNSTRPMACDVHTGIYQIDIYRRSASGAGDITRTADVINASFYAGAVMTWGGIDVRIDSTSIGPIRQNDGWAVLSVSVNWTTYVERIT